MRINALRRELSEKLTAVPTDRPPAVRRSRRDEWLYATDIKLLLSGKAMESLLNELAAEGWEWTEEQGWLLLRKPAEEPPDGWYDGAFGPEAACCASLLDRHPGRPGSAAERAQRALIKAGEEGEKAYEAACACLHREWAERLRCGEPLPALSSRYFGK